MSKLTPEARAFRARFAKYARTRRTEVKWTQVKAAEKCGVGEVYYRRVELALAAIDHAIAVRILRGLKLKKADAVAMASKLAGAQR